jgi:tRNA threonylcarbamoyladenosine biosynthesis protein TsaE
MPPRTGDLDAAYCFHSRSEKDTERLGAVLANSLQAGDVVSLVGELGTGKTRLVRAVVEALSGEHAQVSSPTFVLIQHYAARVPICHMDVYRLSGVDEFLAVGGDELLEGESICLIEWGDRLASILPGDHLRIELSATGEQSRQLRLCISGPRSRAMVAAVAAQLQPDSTGDAESSESTAG